MAYSPDTQITKVTTWRDGRVATDSDTGDSGVCRIRGWAKDEMHRWAQVREIKVTIISKGRVTVHIFDGDDQTWTTK